MAYLEPLIGGIAAFALGAIWYTALFGKAWQAETGISDDQAQSNIVRTHGIALIMMIVMSYAVNIIINYHEPADQTFVHGGFHGILAGLFYAAPAIAIQYNYQRKSLKLYLIDAVYTVLMLGLSGGVMAALKLG